MAAQRASFATDNYAPSQQPPASNVNVFGDEFEEDYAESIHTTASRREDPFRDPIESTGPSHIYANDLHLTRSGEPTFLQARNSIRKSNQDLANIRNMAAPNAQAGVHQHGEPVNQRLSMVSTSEFAAPQSPTVATATGPSHPYTMYPQNFAHSRSNSIASARSAVAASSSTAQRGPMHPYNLYAQTVSSESSGGGSQATAVPIGFPGHGQQFTRRLGPEGEEQDIIDPHGHTEQLPPYSRYPDTYDNKAAAVGLLSATGEPADGERAPHTPVEMQERQPVEGDAHLADAPDPGRDARSNANPAEVIPAEKTWKEKTWKEKRKTKLWGPLSVGAVLLTVVVIIIIAVICGGVIGGVLGRKHPKQPPGQGQAGNNAAIVSAAVTTVTTTQYIDAAPTPAPSTAEALPTGSFEVELTAMTNVSTSACLENTNQQSAWSCDIPNSQQAMNVTVFFNQYGQAILSLTNLTADVDYGAQAPVLPWEQLQTVVETNYTQYGVAYHFQGLYTKTVVLPETALTSLTTTSQAAKVKRYAQTAPVQHGWGDRKHVDVHDQPWFCYWSNTIIEGFLFLDENLYETNSTTYFAESQESTSSSAPNPSTSSAAENPYTTSCATCYSPSTVSASPSTTTTTCTETSAYYKQWYPPPSGPGPTFKVKRTSAASTSATAPAPTSTSLYAYPRLMKMEEMRRSLDGTTSAAICTKMSKGTDNRFTIVDAGDGTPITVALEEQDASGYGSRKRSSPLQKRAGGQCKCEWNNVPDN